MKLLLENWRKYLLKEDDPSLQRFDPTGHDSRVRKQMSKMQKRSAEEAAKQTAWLAVQMVDLTGIAGYGDAGRAHDEWIKNPTAANSGWYILAILGALPIIGKLMAPLKAAKAAKKIKQMATAIEGAETTVKALKTTKNADNLVIANMIERALPAARAEIAELQEYMAIFQKHMVDNVPIDKVTALKIIKRFPSLKVANETVYRGMRVDANFIKKNFGDDVFRKCCGGDPGTMVLEKNIIFKPRSKSGTSSWSLDRREGDLWAQDPFRSPVDKPYEILYVGAGKNNKGLKITKAAKDMKHPMATQDFAEVSMIGSVEVKKVVIVNNAPRGAPRPRSIYAVEKQAKQMHRVPAQDGIDLPPGFYPAGSRKEILKLIGKLKEVILREHRYLLG